MTPNATYNDIKTHLAKPNEIEAVTNIEASNKDYVIRKNAKNFIKSGKEYVKLFETVQENMDKLTVWYNFERAPVGVRSFRL